MMAAGENAVEQECAGAAGAVPADAAAKIAFVEDPAAEAVERARSGERAGWASAHVNAETGDVALALIARPAVRMGDFHAVPFVAAMGARDAFAALGAAKSVGIRWPHDLVCAAPDFNEELATVAVKAGAGEGGMFAVVSLELRAGAFAVLELGAPSADTAVDTCDDAAADAAAKADAGAAAKTDTDAAAGIAPANADESPLTDPVAVAPQLAAAILARIDVWASALAGNRAVAGPLAPVLGEYFDMVPALGHRAAAVSPSGHPLAIGTFAGVDVWGRATIKTTVDEREFAPEVARIRTL